MKFKVQDQHLLDRNMVDYMYGFGFFIKDHSDGEFTFKDALNYFSSDQVTGINNRIIDILYYFLQQEDDTCSNLVYLLYAVKNKALSYCKNEEELLVIKKQLETFMSLHFFNDIYNYFAKEITNCMGK